MLGYKVKLSVSLRKSEEISLREGGRFRSGYCLRIMIIESNKNMWLSQTALFDSLQQIKLCL